MIAMILTNTGTLMSSNAELATTNCFEAGHIYQGQLLLPESTLLLHVWNESPISHSFINDLLGFDTLTFP